eukprot:9079717-Pyramimonas_sp.AAC.1
MENPAKPRQRERRMGSRSAQRSALTPQQNIAWPERPPTKPRRLARRMGSRSTQRSALAPQQNM